MVTAPAAFDEDALMAAADLVARTGAKHFAVGYLNDEPPHRWYAHAQYRGTRIICEDQPDPVAAADGLARQLLTGAQCQHCGRLVTLDPAGAYAHDSTLLDGRPWTAQQQAAAGVCFWRRKGRSWVRGCEGRRPEDAPTRRERRAADRQQRRRGQR